MLSTVQTGELKLLTGYRSSEKDRLYGERRCSKSGGLSFRHFPEAS